MPGPIFGKYEVIKRLAVGGMGEVFLARQTGIPGFERHSILKSLLPDVAEQAGAIDEFLDEARVAATLNHPNVVSIYEVGLWEGIYYIAMEYIDGENLSGLRKAALACGQFVPYEVTAQLVHDAAEGLDHAHKARDMTGKAMEIVHRDISPQNIMVRRDGVAKVVDFGIARAANRSTRTKTGMTKGKLAYMPPEQVRGLKVDGRSDQYALGVVLWELLTGQRLFIGDSDVELIKMVLRGEVPKPTSIDASIPAELESITMQMLSREPADRFGSCHDVAVSLAAWIDHAAPGMGSAEVSHFVISMLDGWKARAESPTKPIENFVIDLQGPPSTGPKNSGVHVAAVDGGAVPAISSEPGAQVKPRVAVPRSDGPTIVPPGGPTTFSSLGVAPPARAKPKRTPVAAIVAGAAAIAVAGGLGLHALLAPPPAPPPPVVAVAPPLPPPVAAPLPRAQLRVHPDVGMIAVDGPPGAQIDLDGKRWPTAAPCEITKLPPGQHRVRLVLADGRELAEEEVELAPPAVAKLRIASVPPGAEVVLAGKVLGTTPFETDQLPPDVEQDLEVRLPGHRSEHRKVKVSRGLISDVQVTLAAMGHPGRPTSRPTPAIAQATPTPAPAAAFGFLTLDTKPWSQVEIDGALVGPTPLINKKLAVGSHQVVLVNEGASIRSTKTVTISANDTTKLLLKLP